MAVKRIAQLGNPVLKAENEMVVDFNSTTFHSIVADLKDTMTKNGLVGIAAPQIGSNFRIFVTHPRSTKTRNLGKSDVFRVFANPSVIHTSSETSLIYEGCGSVARGEIFGPVIRPKEITIKAQDENGSFFTLTCNGLLARVILHEYDHLDGVEFTEKIADYSKLLSRTHYRKCLRSAPEQIKASMITTIEYTSVTS